MEPSDASFLGLKLYEWLTLLGIITGPIVAVCITLAIEGRRQKRERRTIIARILMGTRHTPADAQYNGAINLIPMEFNDRKDIMAAWQKYIEAVRLRPTEENRQAQNEIVTATQSTLIYKITKYLGYDISENDIRSTAYLSGGFVDRDNLMLGSWHAMIRIANALERQSETIEQVSPNQVEPAPGRTSSFPNRPGVNVVGLMPVHSTRMRQAGSVGQ